MGPNRDTWMAASRRAQAPIVLLGALDTVALLVQMNVLSRVVSRVVVQRQGTAAVAGLLALLLGVLAIRAVLVWLEARSAGAASVRLTTMLRERLFGHLLQLGPTYIHQERSGELVTTAVDGVDQVDTYYGRYVALQQLAVVTPVLVIAYAFVVDPLGGGVLLLTVPIIPLLMVFIGKYSAVHVQRHWLALSRLGAQFLDAVQGLPTVLLFGRGAAVTEEVRAASAAFQERTMQVLRVAFLSGMVLEIATGMAIGLVAVTVAVQLLAGALSFQAALLVLLVAPECYRPLRELGAQRHIAMEGKAAAQRVEEVLRTPPPTAPQGSRAALPHAPLTVTFSGVGYRYPASDTPAVDDFTLTLASGTQTALVGRSGAGKSTVLSLLLRFLDPTSGAISVNGVDLAALAPEDWRTLVAYVPQRPHLFTGSIADNLRLARPNASQRELEWAAEQAGVAAFIASLPKGYDTPVGEQGALLSGGQVQRLAIARAFLKDAPLLVLDEPTSALDPAHEVQIRQSIENLMRDRTVLVVAHRRNTVLRADAIAVLDHGRLVEAGKHRELVGRGGAYDRLMTPQVV